MLWGVFGVSVFAALIGGFALIGPSTAVVLPMLSGLRGEVSSFLRFEALLNAQLDLVFALALLDLLSEGGAGLFSAGQGLVVQVIVGIGAGVVGFLVWHASRGAPKRSRELLLFLLVFLSAFVAQVFGGSAVVAMLAFGLLVGAVIGKRKAKFTSRIERGEDVFAVVIILMYGVIARGEFPSVAGMALVLVFFYGARFLAISRHKTKWSLKERLLATAVAPKGVGSFWLLFYARGAGIAGFDVLFPTLMWSLIALTVVGVAAGQVARSAGMLR